MIWHWSKNTNQHNDITIWTVIFSKKWPVQSQQQKRNGRKSCEICSKLTIKSP